MLAEGSKENASLVLGDCCQLQGTESLELWLAHNVPCRLTAVAALLDSLENERPEKYPVSKNAWDPDTLAVLEFFSECLHIHIEIARDGTQV